MITSLMAAAILLTGNEPSWMPLARSPAFSVAIDRSTVNLGATEQVIDIVMGHRATRSIDSLGVEVAHDYAILRYHLNCVDRVANYKSGLFYKMGHEFQMAYQSDKPLEPIGDSPVLNLLYQASCVRLPDGETTSDPEVSVRQFRDQSR